MDVSVYVTMNSTFRLILFGLNRVRRDTAATSPTVVWSVKSKHRNARVCVVTLPAKGTELSCVFITADKQTMRQFCTDSTLQGQSIGVVQGAPKCGAHVRGGFSTKQGN